MLSLWENKETKANIKKYNTNLWLVWAVVDPSGVSAGIIYCKVQSSVLLILQKTKRRTPYLFFT